MVGELFLRSVQQFITIAVGVTAFDMLIVAWLFWRGGGRR